MCFRRSAKKDQGGRRAKNSHKKDGKLPGKWVEQKDGWYQQVPRKDCKERISTKKTGKAVENGPRTRDTVHRPVFGAVQSPAKEDPVAHLRARKKRGYKAKDLYFKGFARMPLGRLRVEISKLVPAKHIIKLSFVKGNLRVTV